MAQQSNSNNQQDATLDPQVDSDSDSPPIEVTSPTGIRQMVLNYLIHHCYIETAIAFANDGVHLEQNHNNTTNSSSHHASPQLSRSNSNNRQTEMEVDNLLSIHPQLPSTTATATTATTSKDRIGELSDNEIQSVKTRRDVKDHILNGRIRQAIDLLNSHFPLVLNGSPSSNPPSTSNSNNRSSSSRAQTKHSNGTSINNGGIGGSTSNSSTEKKSSKEKEEIERTLPANPTSLEPSHLFLNLQIQAFIESVRNASSSNSNSVGVGSSSIMNGHSNNNSNGSGIMSSPLPSLAATTPGIASHSNLSRSSSPAPSSAASSTGSTSQSHSGNGNGLNPNVFSSLSLAQTLFTNVQKLPSYWRAMYLKELENVTALLAYTDLEKSPVRKYLDQTRRVALAEQINSAILYRSGRPSQPLIESAVRQNTFIWSQLHSDNVSVPSGHPVLNELPASATVTDAKKGGKILPSWDLKSFLAER